MSRCRIAGLGITVVAPRPIEVVGQDFLAEISGPCVFWVVDGTPDALRSGLRAAGWQGRVRVVAPSRGRTAQRRGPSVALLVDDPRIAGAHLEQLMPVPVVPIWFGGCHAEDDPLRVRIAAALSPAPGEGHASLVARVIESATALAAEESLSWWQVLTGATPTAPQTRPGGWRQRWARTEPLAQSPRIWD